MRISNINQYAGGANAVVAQEINDGNQITKTINVANTDFTSATFDIDVELFNMVLATRGSNVTITSLTKTAGYNARNLPEADVISNKTNGSFDLTVPATLLQNFGTSQTTRFTITGTGAVGNANWQVRNLLGFNSDTLLFDPTDTETLDEVTAALAQQLATSHPSGFGSTMSNGTNGTVDFTYSNAGPIALPEFTKLGGGDFAITPTVLTTGAKPVPTPDATEPFAVAMKVQWKTGSGNTAQIRSFRMWWIIRYQPNVGLGI